MRVHWMWIVPFEIIDTDKLGIMWPCKAQENNAVPIAPQLESD